MKLRLLVLFLFTQVSISTTCSIVGDPTNAGQLCLKAEIIVRAIANKYFQAPDSSEAITTGTPESLIEFIVLDTLKGTSIPKVILLNGYLNDKDDFNDRPVPYNFVRRNGRRGSCYANTYKKGAEYLLFIKRKNNTYTVGIGALSPVNEQLHNSEDPWYYYIKGYLKCISDEEQINKKQ